ncbi:MAG: hypothetical protein HFE63_05490 [Clostridiales bacterium]|nr:hypothetical protein [Clostridiales bacterium]
MLEEITLSVSTFLFLICSLIIGSLAPSTPAEQDMPSESIIEYADEIECMVGVDTAVPERFSIVGVWQCFDCTYEFTKSGTLIVGDKTMRYQLHGDELIIDGAAYPFEAVNSKVIKIDNRTLYRVK